MLKIRMGQRRSDTGGAFGPGVGFAGRRLGRGRRGLLQDRGRAAVAATAAVATTGVHVARVTRVRVGVRPGTPWNRGGPVNRIGRR
jgi:hypothetical protein